MTDLAFVICVEHGRLEGEGILLAESIREWAGRAADAPVYAYAPRPQRRPEEATVKRLSELGVTYIDEPLEGLHEEHPTFNKVPVCAHAERELAHETLVFADTDSVFLAEPAELLDDEWVAAMRPVDRRIAGSRGKGKNEPFWQRMYETLEVRSEPYVETVVGNMQIRAYWNSGLIAARRESGLFQAWEAALARLFEAGVVHQRMPQFMDQLSWAAVVADVHDRVRILSDVYNYPLRQRGGLPEAMRDLDLAEIAHLHYRLFFHLPDPLGAVTPPFAEDTPQYRWLAERLPIEPIVDEA